MRDKGRITITYWAPGEPNAYEERSFDSPTVFVGHWEDRQEQVRTQAGLDITSKAIVHIPDTVSVAEGGFLAKDDHLADGNPVEVSGAWEIQSVVSIPSMRNATSEQRAIL